MSNSFDVQLEDQCLGFIRDDSFIDNPNLFSNYQHQQQIDEQQMNVQPQFGTESKSGKRNRTENHIKSNSKKKVFYRDKMANLISEEDLKKCEGYNYGDYSENVRGKSPISRQQQLKRNRESAKHSRQRRKQYVQALQVKNNENTKKIEELTLKLRQVEIQRDRLKQDSRSYIKNFLSTKNQAYETMSEILKKNDNRSSDKLSEELRIIMSKYGAAGSERIAATDYYMKQIIQILLGDVHKYIVDCAVSDSGLLGLGPWRKLDEDICQILKTSKQSRIKFNKAYKLKMITQFDTFKAVTQNFYDAYKTVQNQAKIIQKIFENIALQFNDVSIAQLLLWLEQNKFSRQLKKIKADWARSCQQSQQQSVTGKARKIGSFEVMQSQF